MALCTTQNVKDYINDTGTGRDTIIAALIPAAQSFIEEYCRRVFEKAQVTEYHHGGADRLFLKRFPIADTPAPVVYEDQDRVYSVDDIVDSEDYFIDNDNGIIFFDWSLQSGRGAIKIIYTGGYDTIPQAVRQACVELVAKKVKTGGSGDIGVISRGMPGGTTVTFNVNELLPETKEALDLFVRENSAT